MQKSTKWILISIPIGLILTLIICGVLVFNDQSDETKYANKQAAYEEQTQEFFRDNVEGYDIEDTSNFRCALSTADDIDNKTGKTPGIGLIIKPKTHEEAQELYDKILDKVTDYGYEFSEGVPEIGDGVLTSEIAYLDDSQVVLAMSLYNDGKSVLRFSISTTDGLCYSD